MKVAIIYNKDSSNVINTFGMQNKEKYNPKTVKAVEASLENGGHNVSIIDGDMHVIESLQEFMPKVLEGERMGMVFNMAYGIQGESRYTHIPSLLEMLGIPYVGSSPAGHALALDKVITKIIMQKHGIPTPQFWVFNSQDENFDDVIFPVIVKPKMEAVSFGLRVVHNVEDLREAVQFIVKEFEQQALVEQFIRGREFAIGLLGNTPVEAFPVLEIDLDRDPDAIQSVDDKKSKPRKKICPAVIPQEEADEMIKWSIAAFKALGLRDFSRVDIRLSETGEIYLLEINSMASLGKTGSYFHAAQAVGLDYKALVNKMLDVAAVRYFAETKGIEIDSNRSIPLHIRIRGFLRSRQTHIENLLSKMVNINTHVRNTEGVNSLGIIMVKELKALRFNEKSYPNIELGNNLFFSNTDEPLDILFLGNLDNRTHSSSQEYFNIQGQKIYGTGVWEHKGGLVVLLGTLMALRFTRKLSKIKIGILLTSDDSIGGLVSRQLVEEYSREARTVIGLHGAFLNGGIVTSRSGSASYKISMNLKNREDSENVSDAARIYFKLMADIITMSRDQEGLVISPAHSNFESNITEPFAHGESMINVRFNIADQFEEVDVKIRKILNSRQKNSLYDLRFEGKIGRYPMERTKEVELLYTKLKSIADTIDVRLLEEHRWSSSDICNSLNNNRIDGFGPIGIKPHEKSEYIIRHSILERIALLALSVLDLSR